MKNKNIESSEKYYYPPQIQSVKLDNKIALVLNSTPPIFENETKLSTPDYFNPDPYKNNT